MSEFDREPCPHRILDDMGGAFAMGACGGFLWHGIRGARNSPRGERLTNGFANARKFAPRLGGGFAVWGGLFSSYDCIMVAVREKEDPLNAITAGFMTGATISLRAGPSAALRAGLMGGVFLAVIEGLGIAFTKFSGQLAMMGQADQLAAQAAQDQPAPQRPGIDRGSIDSFQSAWDAPSASFK